MINTVQSHRIQKIAKDNVENSNCKTSMAAIIVKGGKILSHGYNKKGYRGKSLHAEIDALNKLRWQKNGAAGSTITVIRYLADDSFGASLPCPKCMLALKKANVKRVNYFDYDGIYHTLRI